MIWSVIGNGKLPKPAKFRFERSRDTAVLSPAEVGVDRQLVLGGLVDRVAPVEHGEPVPEMGARERLRIGDGGARPIAELVAVREAGEGDVGAVAVGVRQLTLQ